MLHRVMPAAIGGALFLSGTALVAPGAGAASAATLPTRTPAWAASATKTGQLAASAPISLTVTLALHNQAAAEAAAQAVSTPSSASYGKFLSASAFRAAYSPTNAEVATVSAWLTAAGFTVTSVPQNHGYVRVSGTAAAAKKAFGTTLDGYTLGGQRLHAPVSAVTLPSTVSPLISGVIGLTSDTTRAKPLNDSGQSKGDLPGGRATSSARTSPLAPPSDAFVNARPCSAYYGQKLATTLPTAFGAVQPYAPCGYTPAQLRGAYGVDRSGGGKGVTVAVVDAYASPTIKQDADTYAVKRGDKPFARGQFRQVQPAAYQYGYDDTVNGDLCGEQGWYGEETLDVEAVHGIAPKANITYVAASSCDDPDLLDALTGIVDNHLADIVTNSWGDYGEGDPTAPGDLTNAYNRVFIQGALEGIGFLFSSGDNGDEVDNTGVRTVDAPADSPWVTAVGGTSLGVGSKNNYLFETGWGTGKSVLTDGAWTPPAPGNWIYGAGGGTSQLYAQPWYQRGVVPSSISRYFGGRPGRAVPDIATVGDPSTGFLVGQTQTFLDGSVKYSEYRIGGTSLSSPLFAGIEALADQAAHHPHGFANPAIYALADSRAVRDVKPSSTQRAVVRVDYVNGVDATAGTVTSLRSLDQTQSLGLLRGYDDVTGVGSPNGNAFVYALGRRHR